MTQEKRTYTFIILSLASFFLLLFFQDLSTKQFETGIHKYLVQTLFNLLGITIIFIILKRKKQALSVFGLKKVSFADIVPVTFSTLMLLMITAGTYSLLYFLQFIGPLPLLTGEIKPAAFIIPSLAMLATGFFEELFFRGWINYHLEKLSTDKTRLIVINALLFALPHLSRGPWGFLTSLFAGAYLTALFLFKRNIVLNALVHGIYNIIVLVLLS